MRKQRTPCGTCARVRKVLPRPIAKRLEDLERKVISPPAPPRRDFEVK